MGLRTAVTAWREQRRGRRTQAAAARHDAARAARRDGTPTTRDVAIGGQTGGTVA